MTFNYIADYDIVYDFVHGHGNSSGTVDLHRSLQDLHCLAFFMDQFFFLLVKSIKFFYEIPFESFNLLCAYIFSSSIKTRNFSFLKKIYNKNWSVTEPNYAGVMQKLVVDQVLCKCY